MSETAKPVKGTSIQLKSENKVYKITQNIIAQPVKLMVGISTVVLAAIVLLITADVIGRYIFKRPVYGADELSGLLFLCVAACAFAYTQKEGSHIRIELFIKILPRTGRFVINIFNYLVALGMTSLICWQAFVSVRKLVLNLQGGSQASEILGIPWLPFVIILGLGFGVFALVILNNLIMTITKQASK